MNKVSFYIFCGLLLTVLCCLSLVKGYLSKYQGSSRLSKNIFVLLLTFTALFCSLMIVNNGSIQREILYAIESIGNVSGKDAANSSNLLIQFVKNDEVMKISGLLGYLSFALQFLIIRSISKEKNMKGRN